MPPSNIPIPGYVFDEEKNRYFKIMPNNMVPEGSRFSAQEVKRRDMISSADSAPSPPIKRLGNGVKLLREVGLSRTLMKESIMECWANGLERRTLFYSNDPRLNGPDILHFVRDELTGVFLFARGALESNMKFISAAKPLPFQAEELEEGRRDPSAGCRFVSGVLEQAIESSSISSLSLSRSRLLLATHVNHKDPIVTFLRLWDLPTYETRMNELLRDNPPEQVVILPNLPKIRPFGDDKNVSAWCSAANPFSEQSKFAVGFNGYVSAIAGGEDCFSLMMSKEGQHDTIFGVDWLDYNITISGGRGGKVRLWDTRTRGESMRFRHPTRINHVRKLEGSRVAVAGTNEDIFIQDLRIPPKQGRKMRDPPYMAFPTSGGPVASSSIAGFDVHGDLIAAATADGRVQLFNVHSGKELRMRRIENQEGPRGGQKRFLKFVEDEGQPIKLYVASDGAVEEWSW